MKTDSGFFPHVG